MPSKQFHPLAIAETLSGITLTDPHTDGYRAVMDVLFPGIMDMGIVAMHDRAKTELKRQHPEIAAMCEGMTPSNWQEYSDRITQWADTHNLPVVVGPLEVSDEEAQAAFDRAWTGGNDEP